MKTFKQIFQTAIAACSFALLLTSCQKSVVDSRAALSAQTSSSSELSDEELEAKGSLSFPLTAGQSIPVGKVVVSKDDANLYITYITKNGWKLQEVHAKIENAETYVPGSNKDIAPGQFPYSQTFTGDVNSLPTEYTIVIPLSSVNCDNAIIYAHAAVVKCEDGLIVQSETAWGGNIVPPSKGLKWYGYIICEVRTRTGNK
jgi:hypothetical protein